MGNYWNRDYQKIITDFLSPVTGPIGTEYLSNEPWSVAMETQPGRPSLVSFVDGSRISRFDFNLYIRCDGRDTAARKRAMDTLMAAGDYCASKRPFPEAYVEMTGFPHLFNRNMSGNEEYKAEFSLYFITENGGNPLFLEVEYD